ncbi:MAG: hypothetical protein ACI9N1_001363 [Flavobacteriales bacterium]|jgi:hypothetical protein
MAKRNSNEESINEVMTKLMKSYGLGRNYEEYQITQIYNKLMGNTIVRYTKDVFFKEGRLYVTITNGVIREELNMGKTPFIKMMNEELGEQVILDVVFS